MGLGLLSQGVFVFQVAAAARVVLYGDSPTRAVRVFEMRMHMRAAFFVFFFERAGREWIVRSAETRVEQIVLFTILFCSCVPHFVKR